MKSFSPYTDLAIESRENFPDKELEGITQEETVVDSIKITWVKVTDDKGASLLSKPKGNYITIEARDMKENDSVLHENIALVLSEKLMELMQLKKDSLVLVVGLGNWNITPDSLGPKTASKILVTRHVLDHIPKELQFDVCNVACITPGVLGTTGMETAEIIQSVANSLKPDYIIAIDALAAKNIKRINATIQITDTGIVPGGGMGNKRSEISHKTLGVPVIAIGIPTVVDAATLVNDSLDKILAHMIKLTPANNPFYKILLNMEEEEKYQMIHELLSPYGDNMFVTPKEVDAVIERFSNIVANGINMALHPAIDPDEMHRYL